MTSFPSPWLLIFSLTLVLAAVDTSAAKVRRYKWEVGYVLWSPDCFEATLIGINGRFPGPTVRAKAGDTIVVELKNTLFTEGVVIHWHGIRQLGTPWMDGTASITQCAINPEETYVYRFKVDKPGTYFYHGHLGMQRAAGLYGSLIVDVEDGHKEPFHYDGEINLLLSDFYHKDVVSQATGLTSDPFRWVGEPQSLLINGRGQFGCSLAAHVTDEFDACNITSKQCRPVVLPVEPNKTYRLRLASSTSLASLNLAIGNHKLVVVEADGNYVKPFAVEDMDIYSGESYSVLLHTDQHHPTNHWLSVSVRGRRPATPPALAVLSYRSTSRLPTSPPPVAPAWNDHAHSKAFTHRIRALGGSSSKPPPSRSDRRIVLLNTQNHVNGGRIRWAINNVSLTLPPTPYLGALKHNLEGAFDRRSPPEDFPWDYDVMRPPANANATLSSNIYVLEFNGTIDVVLQNANALAANVSEIHPWHMHGHDFWVLGYGEGRFGEKDVEKFNLEDPPLRNTVVIFPYGWTALRFVADNPGAWAFHCHIEPHLQMGMGVVLAEGIELLGDVPKEALGCGMTAKVLMDP